MRALVVPNDLKPSGALGGYMFARSIDELAEAAMSRLEQARGVQEREGLLEEIMCAVALSRRGLSEMEILGLVQVPRAVFSTFYTETRQVFKVLFGLLSFTFSAFERVVRRRYLCDVEVRINCRQRLAAFFLSKPLSHRQVEEVPFQLLECRKWQELSQLIMRPDVFTLLCGTDSGRFDLLLYWEALLDPARGAISITDRCDDSMRQARDSAFTSADQAREDRRRLTHVRQ
ncbi:hypothetical protein T484DRAFT_3564813 [Baffinella frigidus]|nr:hypothetical protein T484DRAFT_3564813 [Cryptophyta sp. CCMP2293]